MAELKRYKVTLTQTGDVTVVLMAKSEDSAIQRAYYLYDHHEIEPFFGYYTDNFTEKVEEYPEDPEHPEANQKDSFEHFENYTGYDDEDEDEEPADEEDDYDR